MKISKKLISLALAVAMMLSMSVVAFADSATIDNLSTTDYTNSTIAPTMTVSQDAASLGSSNTTDYYVEIEWSYGTIAGQLSNTYHYDASEKKYVQDEVELGGTTSSDVSIKITNYSNASVYYSVSCSDAAADGYTISHSNQNLNVTDVEIAAATDGTTISTSALSGVEATYADTITLSSATKEITSAKTLSTYTVKISKNPTGAKLNVYVKRWTDLAYCTLSYSIDGGTSWTEITNVNTSADLGYVTDTVKFKISRTSSGDGNDCILYGYDITNNTVESSYNSANKILDQRIGYQETYESSVITVNPSDYGKTLNVYVFININ